ncbi:YggN family protein [Pseudoalteromonas sp. MMG010]|uniref:DUF2884 family protein n=1 Tax=Pseudoalteromonas sp. MMG010 TaxID=2822685 RepID=UPI001B3A466B|nr:DUF2884 family protein [Pseudoalteromonas sp. MMG010]MBQ4834458.1 YggN family protein [Pseudoalteromonas sp. MMG010]
MKKFLLVSALICSPAVLAHTDQNSSISFNNEQCGIEFKNDIRIKPNELEIFTAEHKTMRFSDQGQLSIDGEVIELTPTQLSTLNQYTDNLRGQLPEVANVALEGVKIAEVAIGEVAEAFNLSGLEHISTLMDGIHTEVENTFYQKGAFVMGQQSFEQFGNHFEQHFESQIEEAVESALMQSMGSILIALGSEVMGSGGDMQAFEQRMENMGLQIEAKVEQQAERLKTRAESLCEDFTIIAQQEQLVSMQVPALQGYELFEIKNNIN